MVPDSPRPTFPGRQLLQSLPRQLRRSHITLSFGLMIGLVFGSGCGDLESIETGSEQHPLREGPLHVTSRLEVSPTLMGPGDLVQASVTYANRTHRLHHLTELVIVARHGRTGEERAFEPAFGPAKLLRGATVTLEADLIFSSSDPRGVWYVQARHRGTDGQVHETSEPVMIGLVGPGRPDSGTDPIDEPGEDPDPGEEPGSDPVEDPPAGDLAATFFNARGNEWWVEIQVRADRTIASVDARVNEGGWRELEPTDWGSWAGSFFVATGSLVQFRAQSASGAEALSGIYSWPDARLVEPDETDPPVDEPEPPVDEPEPPVDTHPGTPGTPWLRTQGNQIVDPDGNVWIGRGFNIHDTRSCNACTWTQPNVGEVKRRIDEAVDVWGADFLRLNLEAYGASGGRVHWQNVTQDARYLADVVEIVRHIGTKPGVYVLVSLWHDPTFNSQGWPTQATIPVWELLAREMRDMSHVMYGLVNEPQHNWDGSQDPQVWAAMNNVVAAIRRVQDQYGSPRTIIAVQGTGGWARSVDYYRTNPITAGGGVNIVYETHPYNRVADFHNLYERAAQTIPVIIGEFGPFASMTTSDAEQLMDRAELRGIPYLAWTFHMRCPPNLLVDHSGGGCGVGMRLEPTAWGRQLINRLANPPARP